MSKIEKPREPLSVGAVVIWTIINPLLGLIALCVRNSAIRDGEPRITPPKKDHVPAALPMGPFFRIVMLVVAVAILFAMSMAISHGRIQ